MLMNALTEDFTYKRLVFVLGILADKDVEKMVSFLAPHADYVVVTRSHNVRACEPAVLKDIIKKSGYEKDVFIENSIPRAVEHAISLVDTSDFICITGSLFTVGEARSYLLARSRI